MAFTLITVTGQWTQPQTAKPSRGTVDFRLYEPLTDQDTLQVSSGTTSVRLSSAGTISVVLAASNDPTSRPEGIPYLVTENIDNVQRTYYVVIPYDAPGGTVDLAALVPLQPPFPGFDPAQVPPSPVGQPDGLAVLTLDGAYVLGNVDSFTGAVVADYSTATPDGDGLVPVDLSDVAPSATGVIIRLPSWPSVVTAVVTMPPTNRGLLALAAIGASFNPVGFSVETPFGIVQQSEPAQPAAIMSPVTFGDISFWSSIPAPGGGQTGLYSANTVEATIDTAAATVLSEFGITVPDDVLAQAKAIFTGNTVQPGFTLTGLVLNASFTALDLLVYVLRLMSASSDLSNTDPLPPGPAAPGVSTAGSRSDHVHPPTPRLPQAFPAESGQWYAQPGSSIARAPGLIFPGSLRAEPLWLAAGHLEAIGVIVSTPGTATWRLGIYPAGAANQRPDGLDPLVDAGTIDMSVAGLRELAIDLDVAEGWYWPTVVCEDYTSDPVVQSSGYEVNTVAGLGLPADMNNVGRSASGLVYGSSVPLGGLGTFPVSSLGWCDTVPRIYVRYT